MREKVVYDMHLNGELVWWQALNPAIYLISILPAVGVILISDSIFLEGIIMATAAVVLLQHAINLFNDVSDWRLGADVNKQDSWVRVYNGNTGIVNRYAIMSFFIGGLLGLLVLHLSDKYWILLFASPVLLLGYLYNAGTKPLSYTALGEWVTGLCYGPGVFGCLYLLSNNELTLSAFLGMFTFGCLAMALLLSHQPPQINDDRAADKKSFAVRYGQEITILTARYLFVAALVSFSVGLYLTGDVIMVAAFLLMAMIATGVIYRNIIKPKIFLLSASVVFSGTLVVKLLFFI